VADIPVPPEADPREPLGRLVRETWVAWAREQPRPWKASHLTGWDDLGADDREVDMRIGAAVAAAERARIAEGAKAAAFALFRPGNGPGAGQRLDVVPLSELRTLIGDPDA
jgi:hypothetical protein